MNCVTLSNPAHTSNIIFHIKIAFPKLFMTMIFNLCSAKDRQLFNKKIMEIL